MRSRTSIREWRSAAQRQRARGIFADARLPASFSTNLHKWGLVQFDCSPLFLRDRSALSSALTVTPEFLRTRQGDAGSVLDMRNMQIPLGRRFRSLKVWFVLRCYGVEGFQRHIRSG